MTFKNYLCNRIILLNLFFDLHNKKIYMIDTFFLFCQVYLFSPSSLTTNEIYKILKTLNLATRPSENQNKDGKADNS